MDPAVVSIVVSALFSVATLVAAWITLRQKVGVDKFTLMQNELRDTKAELAQTRGHLDVARVDIRHLEEQEETCQNLLRETRARYEQLVEDLRAENLSLMRRALGLDPTNSLGG